MTYKPCVLFFACVFGLIGCGENQGNVATENPEAGSASVISSSAKPAACAGRMAWGKKDPTGLQLGGCLDPKQRIIYCIICYEGKQPLSYSDYFLGYWELGQLGVNLRIREDRTKPWRKISHPEGGIFLLKSAGAFKRNIHIIQPGQIMPPGGNQPRSDSGFKYTFSVSLDRFEFPENVSEPYYLQVSQQLGNDGSEGTWSGTLYSGDILVKEEEKK